MKRLSKLTSAEYKTNSNQSVERKMNVRNLGVIQSGISHPRITIVLLSQLRDTRYWITRTFKTRNAKPVVLLKMRQGQAMQRSKAYSRRELTYASYRILNPLLSYKCEIHLNALSFLAALFARFALCFFHSLKSGFTPRISTLSPDTNTFLFIVTTAPALTYICVYIHAKIMNRLYKTTTG